MVSSAAKTVSRYLAELPAERRAVIAEIRRLILANLPAGYVESMAWGMIGYSIPLSRYPDTYNSQPLCYVGLAAQKNNYAIYLSGPYMHGVEAESEFRAGFAAAGKKLDMGKVCVRFRKVDDLALDVIAESIASMSVAEYLRQYERVRAQNAIGTRPRTAPKRPAKKASKKSARGAKNSRRPSAKAPAGKKRR